jgi:hypothetical protein
MSAPKLTRRQAAGIAALLIGIMSALFVVDAQTAGARLTIGCVQRWRAPRIPLSPDVLHRASDECYREGVRAAEPVLTFILLGGLGGLAGAVCFAAGRRSASESSGAPPP